MFRIQLNINIIFLAFFISGSLFADSKLDSLEAVYTSKNKPEEKFEVLSEIVAELENTDRTMVTARAFELLDIAIALKDVEKQGNVSRIIGRNYLFLNNNDSAFIYLQMSNDHFTRIGDSAMIYKNLGNLALIQQRENQYEKAVEMYIQVIEYSKKNNSYYSASSQLVNLASIYIDQENYNSAIECLKEVDEIYNKIPDGHEDKPKVINLFPAVNINLGICYTELKRYNEALTSYDKTLEAAAEIKSAYTKAYYESYAYKNQGDIYTNLAKRLEDEFGLYANEEKFTLGGEFGEDPKKYWEAAISNFREALKGFEAIENERGIIFTKNSLGDALAHNGQNIQAQIMLGEVFNQALEQNFIEEIRDVYEYMAYNEYKLNNPALAYEYHLKHAAFKDTVRNVEREEFLAEKDKQYETLKKDNEIAQLAAENEIQAKKQALSNTIFMSAILGILILGSLLYTRHRYKQQLKVTEFEKNLNNAMARFVPMKFINALGKDKITDVNLGDQIEKEVSVVFTDIRGFTSISERLTPKENFKLVKDYSEKMGPIIIGNNGFINQYMGDGIMAIFDTSPDDALKACIEMQKAVDIFSKEQTITDSEIRVGMGMHTGNLVLGIIGDENRRDAALISDTVNSAARMESSTKILGAKIIVSEESVKKLKNPGAFNLRYIGEFQAKGKEEPLKLYECFDMDTPELKDKKAKTKPIFESALNYYQQGNYVRALTEYQKVMEMNPEDTTTEKYLTMSKMNLSENGNSH